MKLWLVISLGLAALSLCADAASLPVIIRKRQIDSPSNFVRRVVGSPLRPRSGRSGIVQQRTSNVVTSAVPTVNFVQEVTPVLRFQNAVRSPSYFVPQEQRSIPVGYLVEQQQGRDGGSGEEEEEEEEVQESRAAPQGYEVSEASAEVVESRNTLPGYVRYGGQETEGRDGDEEEVEVEEAEEDDDNDAEVQESRPLPATSTFLQPQTVYVLQQTARAQAIPTQYARVLVDPVEAARNRALVEVQPVAILRSTLNARSAGFERAFGYSFEAENGIAQEAEGEMKNIDGTEVMVMRGSYRYTGDDGETVEVEWTADENGFHPTSSKLPRNVEIPYTEQREAVEAQLRFAAEQRAAAEARENSAPAYYTTASASSPAAEVIELREIPTAYGAASSSESRAALAEYVGGSAEDRSTEEELEEEESSAVVQEARNQLEAAGYTTFFLI